MADVQSIVDYDIAGLSTLPNQFSQVPQQPSVGMIVASEYAFNRDGILQTRRGWTDFWQSIYGNVLNFTEFENYIIGWTDQNRIIYTKDGTTIAAYDGTFLPPTPSDPASRVRFFQNNGNLYWTSSVGIWKNDFISNVPQLAGAPQALDMTATLTQSNVGFLSSSASVSYRVLWQYFDANNNLVRGAPSNQIQISNTFIGVQTINVGGTATPSGSTGLANNTTVYVASLLLNGSDNVNLTITGSAAQTYTALLALINTAITGIATAVLQGGNIVITSTLSQGSSVSWADGTPNPLAASLTGFVAINTPVNGTAEVNLEFLVPVGIDQSWTYVIYRGNQSAAANVPGDDEGQQVFAGQPTSAQIASRVIDYVDSLPDDLRGETIYTAPSQQGAGAANFQPPLAQDVEQYRGYTFYFNTATKYVLDVTLVGVGSPDGIQVTDTITLTQGSVAVTLIGGTVEDPSTGTFLISSGSDPATNITLTAQSLTRVLNLVAGNTLVDAFYISGSQGLPGQMEFISRNLPGGAFNLTTNRGGAFTPNLPTSGSSDANTAINDIKPAQILISKYLQPEAVPVGVSGGIIQVGATNYPILRGKANRTSLFIMKGGPEGVYYLSGSSGPVPGAVASGFDLQPFDPTLHMIAPNVCEGLDNSIYIMTDQGVVAISDSAGVAITSRPIELDLLALASLPNFNAVVNSASYVSERQFIMNVPTKASDTTATQSYVYHHLTQRWSTWARPFTAMFVRPSDNKLYAAAPVSGNSQIKVERKTETIADFCDEQYVVTITAAAPVSPVNTQFIILNSVANLQPSQIITQNGQEAIIINVYPSTNRLLIQGGGFVNGPALVSQPIFCLGIFHPITNGAQAVVKKWSEGSLLVLDTTCDDLSLSFKTDWHITESALPIDFGEQFAGDDQWGNSPWGSLPWGITATNFGGRLRTWIPRAFAMSNWIQFIVKSSHISGPLRLQGIGVVAENVSSNQR